MSFVWDQGLTGLYQGIDTKELKDKADLTATAASIAAYSWSANLANIGVGAEKITIANISELRAAVDYLEDNKACGTVNATVNTAGYCATENASFCSANNTGEDGTYGSNSNTHGTYRGTNNTSEGGSSSNGSYCGTDNSPNNSSEL